MLPVISVGCFEADFPCIWSSKYRVIAMDTLGYGESDKPPRECKLPEYAQSVVSFLDTLGIDKTNVVGHHTGASIAVELAAAHSDRVNKLVLSGCPFRKEKIPMPYYMEPITWDSNGDYLRKVWERIQSRYPEDPAEIYQEIALEYFKAGPRGEEALQAAFNYDCASRLPLIKCPTLVLSGRKDDFLFAVEDVQKLIPQSTIFIVEGEGTGVNIIRTSPEAFAQAILNFL